METRKVHLPPSDDFISLITAILNMIVQQVLYILWNINKQSNQSHPSYVSIAAWLGIPALIKMFW